MNVLVCGHCGRVNPVGARYCHYDGIALGTGLEAGPVDVGSSVFPSPFVFPSGRSCRNFNELVLAADELWDEARQLLGDGQLALFFATIGRGDLARAAQAKEAADPERALDDLLQRLPNTARKPPQLYVQPKEFNLGLIQRSETRRLIVVIRNEGMGLLQGTAAAVNTPWLVLGDPPGVPAKMFECRDEIVLRVLLLGDRMRAGPRAQEGALLIESNGGKLTIPIRAERLPRAFFDGVLAGAKSPRQLAEKARAAPKEAIPYFESGAVRAWYEANGWPWPIQGPQAMGLGALQQFFEALGLTSPPRVHANDLFIKFFGRPGETHYHTLKLTTLENRPVYAFAKSELPWLKVGKISGSGKVARINLEATVPDRPGEALLGRLDVTANGGQRIVVAVSMTVAGQNREPTAIPPPPEAPPPEMLEASAVIVLPPEQPAPPPRPSAPDQIVLLTDDSDEAPISPPPRSPAPPGPSIVSQETVLPRRPAPQAPGASAWRLLIGAGAVLLVLLGTLLHDALLPARPRDPGPAPPKRLKLADPTPAIALRWHDDPKLDRRHMPEPTMRFGVILPRERDPNDPSKFRRLLFDTWGRSNNTCLRVDGGEVLFGEGPGELVQLKKPRGYDTERKQAIDGLSTLWRYGTLDVTQQAEVIAGRQSLRLDTCLVRYALENRGQPGTRALRVGLRVMLHTFSGSTSGVPFTLPGRPGLCGGSDVFDSTDAIPDFIEAVERDRLALPGTIWHLEPRVGQKLEWPSRLLVTGYPNAALAKVGFPSARSEQTRWEVPAVSMREMHRRMQEKLKAKEVTTEEAAQVKPESAVTLYWEEKPLGPGERRELGFLLGVGRGIVDPTGRLLTSVGGRFVPGGEFSVVTLVSEPKNETLQLEVPAGMTLVSGSVEQHVPPVPADAERKISVVTWRLRPTEAGAFSLKLSSSAGTAREIPILIHEPGSDGDDFD